MGKTDIRDTVNGSKSMESQSILQGKAIMKLSVYINSGMVTVHVIQARHLQSSRDPVCKAVVKVSLIPDQQQSSCSETEPVSDTNHPVFDEKFSFELLPDDINKRLLISLWNVTQQSRSDEFLGCMSFGIRHIHTDEKIIDGWYYLLRHDIGQRKHVRAIVKKPIEGSTSPHDSYPPPAPSGGSEGPQTPGRDTIPPHPTRGVTTAADGAKRRGISVTDAWRLERDALYRARQKQLLNTSGSSRDSDPYTGRHGDPAWPNQPVSDSSFQETFLEPTSPMAVTRGRARRHGDEMTSSSSRSESSQCRVSCYGSSARSESQSSDHSDVDLQPYTCTAFTSGNTLKGILAKTFQRNSKGMPSVNHYLARDEEAQPLMGEGSRGAVTSHRCDSNFLRSDAVVKTISQCVRDVFRDNSSHSSPEEPLGGAPSTYALLSGINVHDRMLTRARQSVRHNVPLAGLYTRSSRMHHNAFSRDTNRQCGHHRLSHEASGHCHQSTKRIIYGASMQDSIPDDGFQGMMPVSQVCGRRGGIPLPQRSRLGNMLTRKSEQMSMDDNEDTGFCDRKRKRSPPCVFQQGAPQLKRRKVEKEEEEKENKENNTIKGAVLQGHTNVKASWKRKLKMFSGFGKSKMTSDKTVPISLIAPPDGGSQRKGFTFSLGRRFSLRVKKGSS